MDLELLKDFFFWNLILNFAMLLWWFVIFSYKKDFVYKLHSIWFSIEKEKFDAIHYSAMAYYKLAIFIFSLFPYLALQIIL